MKISTIAVVVIILLASCGGGEYEEVKVLNATNYGVGYKILCIRGIEYLAVHQGLSGHFREDGTLHTCDEVGTE